jgi:RNA polymerase-binding transcription factor DksA
VVEGEKDVDTLTRAGHTATCNLGGAGKFTDHMADQGTEAMEREKAAVFATKEGRYLYRMEEALRRLYNDPKSFGTCHTCGADVGFERLDALPHARYCIDCKLKEEEAA